MLPIELSSGECRRLPQHQARAANKMIGQIAAQGDISVAEHELEDCKKENPDFIFFNEVDVRDEVVRDKCLKLYVRLCGHCSSRHFWIDAYDITVKDSLSVERAFRKQMSLSLRNPVGFEAPPKGTQSLLGLPFL